jgi:Tfp pilus assembly protein FimV
MMLTMPARIALLAACLLLAASASAETIYKYRRADGRVVYSNHPVPRLELIETFDYKFPAPAAAPASPAQSKADAEGEARVKKYLDSLQKAWTEVQDATRALAAAEARQRAGVEPREGERLGVASGTAPPAAGGVPPSGPPATGGAMSGHRGRPSPEYVARMEALEADVKAARQRLDAALSRYNQLR